MIEPALLMGFALTALIIELTPGPNMAWLVLLSATEGRRAGFAATAGIAAGLLIVAMIAAFGLATLVEQNPFVYETLRLAGGLFLLYLAWESWQSAQAAATISHAPDKTVRHALRGLTINILNPKAALFYITVLPEFIAPSETIHFQAVALALVSVFIATAVHLSLVVLSASVQKFLSDPARNQIIRRIFAVLLVGVAVWLLVSTAR
jgi:threonine/homoserine/homoserine lactone efflux protein